MQKYYFTYGTDPAYPFQGGWTEVEAPSLSTALELYHYFHPMQRYGFNCEKVLDESKFLATDMLLNGNFGAWCQEEISLSRNLIAADSGADRKET